MRVGGMGEEYESPQLCSLSASLLPDPEQFSNLEWLELMATLSGGGTQEAIPAGRSVASTGHGTEDVPCKSVASPKQEISRNPPSGGTLSTQEELIVLRLPFALSVPSRMLHRGLLT